MQIAFLKNEMDAYSTMDFSLSLAEGTIKIAIAVIAFLGTLRLLSSFTFGFSLLALSCCYVVIKAAHLNEKREDLAFIKRRMALTLVTEVVTAILGLYAILKGGNPAFLAGAALAIQLPLLALDVLLGHCKQEALLKRLSEELSNHKDRDNTIEIKE